MIFKITNIRIDFVPNPYIEDLDAGKAQRLLKNHKQGYLYLQNFCTIKYTKSMYLTVWLKKLNDIDKLAEIINSIRNTLNKVKTTKVKSYEVKVTNIRAQGHFERRINLRIFDDIGVPFSYVLYHVNSKGDHKLIRTDRPLRELNVKYIKLSYLWSNGLQMYFDGYFNIITKDFDALEIVTDTLLYLDTLFPMAVSSKT